MGDLHKMELSNLSFACDYEWVLRWEVVFDACTGTYLCFCERL